ncbi:MAG: helix-turn-helix domain-containing protein [Lachnospiraceae bacterium]|nr:helix-turn-helix transcriptional regulator [Lachnospiraceae bacterium]MCR5835026.1 helix-turn-helix domain-containing protein [Lachnospiraceae bacterium]
MFTLPTIDTVGTGIRIMDLRKKAGLSVKDLQMMLGFATPNAIYKWQNGAAMPTLDNLIVLAAIFNVPIDDIIVIDNKTNMQIGA